MWRRAGRSPAGVPTGLCRRVIVSVCGLVLWAVPGQAQRPVTVQGVHSLTFGVLLAGVNKSVLRTDAINSGQFTVTGPHNGLVLLTFTLPGTMAGPAGATLPLSFGSNDGGWSPPQQVGTQTGFDPRVPYTAPLDQNGKVSVFLGGTAKPTSNQKAGSYSGTITLTVVALP